MKKLKLSRETVRTLTHDTLALVHGAGISQVTVIHTTVCPVMTNGCTGLVCQATIGTSGTSVINPSGG